MLIRVASRTAIGCFLALGLLSGGAAAGINDLQGTKPGDLPNDGEFSSSEKCSGCHRAVTTTDPPQEPDYMPSDTFTGTMMANASRDPVFLAAVAIANQDVPNVGTYCLRCHAPIGFVRGHATPPDGSAFDPMADLDGIIDGQGVGCDVCHRATTAPPPNDPYFLGNAQIVFGYEFADGDGPLYKYGPYEDIRSPNHAGKQDLNLADSRFCGQCHQVTNPEVKLKDATGAATNIEFPLDTTYEEWELSDFARPATPMDTKPDKSCIDCHMRQKEGQWPVTKFQEPLRTNPRDHVLVGGNHWGIQAVQQAFPDRATNFKRQFDLALERTLSTLRSSAKVELVTPPAQAKPGETFNVTVRVENLSGHKFPTGYAESRRAWIAVTLVDASGTERTLLGAYDADTGEVQHDPPTHEYRAVHGRWMNGAAQKEEHLALHDAIVSDTRIPPKGFRGSPGTAPTSEIDYGDGNGGYRNIDEVTFTLTAPADAFGTQTLSARVYYQSMTKEYIDFLKSENTTNDLGDKLEAIYQATAEAPPILVANADSMLDLGDPPPPSGASTSAGAGGNGAQSTEEDGGCGCRAAGDPRSSLGAAALGGLAVAVAAARRRSARRRG
jgi:hypothetical protein